MHWKIMTWSTRIIDRNYEIVNPSTKLSEADVAKTVVTEPLTVSTCFFSCLERTSSMSCLWMFPDFKCKPTPFSTI